MSDFFSKLSENPGGLEEELLGPDYNYFSKIKNPMELNVRADGSGAAISDDLSALGAYGKEILVTGGGTAIKDCGESQTGCVLGQRFFLATGGNCKDAATGEKVTRSLYMDYVPDGSIPFISQGPGGMRFDSMRGLIPGILGNVAQINPVKIFTSFLSGAEPPCRAITMKTGSFPNWSSGTGYVTDMDIEDMNACWFPNGTNPITGANCTSKEGFTTAAKDLSAMPDDKATQLYLASLGVLGLYVLFRFIEKGK